MEINSKTNNRIQLMEAREDLKKELSIGRKILNTTIRNEII